MSTTFEPMGFAPAFDAVINPDLPAGDLGDVAAYAYGRNGSLINDFDFDARWGTPLVIRVTPTAGQPWVGAFAAGGLGVVRTVFACPSSSHLCAVVDGLAYVVDVNAPGEAARIPANAVVRVLAVHDVPLLLLATDTDLAGVGADGSYWSTPRIVLDDLRVLRASAEAIVCSGLVAEDRMATITVTPSTGAVWGSDYR